MLLGASPALAEPTAHDTPRLLHQVRLEYTPALGTDECPSEETFKGRVRMLVGFDPFAADAPVHAVVKLFPAGSPGRFRGRAELREGEELLWERDAEPGDCRVVAGVLAFGITIHLGAPHSEPQGDVPVSPSTPPPPQTPPQPPAAAAPVMPPAAPSSRKVNEDIASQSSRPLVGFYGGGSLVLSTAPSLVAGQIAAGILLQWRYFYVALEGQWQPPAGGDVDGRDVTVSRLTAGPLFCGRYRFLHGCSVAQLGAAFASIVDATPSSQSAFSMWTGARIVLEQSLHSRVVVRVPVDVYGTLRPPQVLLASKRLWLAPKVSAALGLAVVTFF